MVSTQTRPREPIQEALNPESQWETADCLNKGNKKEILAQ